MDLCVKIFINLASDLSNLPGFNSGYSQSNIITLVLPLTHGQHSNIALHSKIFLALINPLLNCEQLHALKLSTKSEASMLVSLLNQAVGDPYHLAQDFTLQSVLMAMIWFTHEYSRPERTPSKKKCSEYEMKLNSVSCELKSNLHLLVDEGVLPAIGAVLKLNGQEKLKATAARLLWSLAHEASVKTQILNDAAMVETLQGFRKFPSLQVASHCALELLGIQTEGMFTGDKNN
jgi:hypothetical protein